MRNLIKALIWLTVSMTMMSGTAFAERQKQKTQGYDNYKASIISDIILEAHQAELSTNVALALAQIESNFDAVAVSDKGAIGVMQIMPATAEGEYGIPKNALFDPKLNIRVGIRFLKELLDRYGRLDIALSHYNGGSKVRQPGGRLKVIPATKHYVRMVMKLAGELRDSTEIQKIIAEVLHKHDLPAMKSSIHRLQAAQENTFEQRVDCAPRPVEVLAEELTLRQKIRLWEREYD